MKFFTITLSCVIGMLAVNNSIAQTTGPATVVGVAIGSANHTTLVAAVQAAGLSETLSEEGPFTVFAPTNAAFDSVNTTRLLLPEYLPQLVDLLQYHVVSGSVMSTDLTADMMPEMLNGETTTITSLAPPMINTANIVTPDITAGNGVVHVVDQVLLPASALNDVVDIAINDPAFATLVDLVSTAGLVETLKGEGPFTIFAPTNDAFAALPAGTIDSLKEADSLEALQAILTYHVTSGVVVSSMLEEDMEVPMLNGATAPPVALSLRGSAKIGDANVIITDILGTNGVVHVIDAVLMPPADEEPPTEEDAATEVTSTGGDEAGGDEVETATGSDGGDETDADAADSTDAGEEVDEAADEEESTSAASSMLISMSAGISAAITMLFL